VWRQRSSEEKVLGCQKKSGSENPLYRSDLGVTAKINAENLKGFRAANIDKRTNLPGDKN